MEMNDQAEARRETQQRRQAPGQPFEVVVPFDSRGRLDDAKPNGSVLLTVEVTNAQGELADWFDNEWWADLVTAWGDLTVTARIAPTPGALLDPVVLYSMEMLRRVVLAWRLVGIAPASEPLTDDNIEQLATSAYHEVRFISSLPEDSIATERRMQPTIDDLFGRIREIQAREKRTHPILVRLPTSEANSSFMNTADQEAVERETAPPSRPFAVDRPIEPT